MPKISIIITTYNSLGFIKPCLDSILHQGAKDIELIIIDNGSKDNTAEFIKEDYPEALLIRNEKNEGACRARNQGIDVSCGDWILTLDCDVTLKRDFFLKILKVIKDLPPKVGMLQPKILRPDKETIYSCGIYLSRIRRFFDIGKEKKDFGQFDESKYIFGACSASGFYSRRMLQDLKEDTGYFDERFFFLVEDMDLAWRAQKEGWKGVFCPEAICYHSGNSSHTSKKLRQYLCFRNRYYSIIKNKGLSSYSKNFTSLLVYDIPRLSYSVFTNPYTFKGVKEIIAFLYNHGKLKIDKCDISSAFSKK